MTPYHFFLLTLAVTAAALAANMVRSRRLQRALSGMARTWHMHYSPRDVFQLAQHIAQRLPTLGAADVCVMDVIYGIESDCYRFIFSVEYTVGVIHAKRRVVRVASLRERRGQAGPAAWTSLELASPDLPLLEQYRVLREQITAGAAPPER